MSRDVILDAVRSAGEIDVAEALTGGELERTIEGASTLRLEVHDPHRRLIRSPMLERAIDLQYEGIWFRLVKLTKTGNAVTLTFEDRDVAYLRQHDSRRKMDRGKHTRAQFVRSLVREVKASPINFYCPEINERQPIGKSTEDSKPTKRTKKDREDKHQKGLPDGADLYVKTTPATKTQRKNGERLLDVADSLGAGPKATVALIEAAMVEADMMNRGYGDKDSYGILQVRASTSGSKSRSMDIEWCARKFLVDGFYRDPVMGSGGAMKKAREHPLASAGEVAQATQGSAYPHAYDLWEKQAKDWVYAYGGASGNDSGGTTVTTVTKRKYEFRRGEPGQPAEDSWACINRLADEVGWRAFMNKGTLYFISDDKLIAAKAKYTWTEDTDGINWIDFDIDQGKRASEIKVSCHSDAFDIPIGGVVAIREMGIANGRWLVSDVRQDLFASDTEVTLVAATPKLAEPANETVEHTKTIPGSKRRAGDKVMTMHDFVDAEDARDYAYAWGGGHASFQRPYDCSGFVSAILHAGGLLDAPEATGQLSKWGKLGEGNFFTVWVKDLPNPHLSHTFMTFTLQGKNKGKQEFAEAGGAESSHTGWHKSRNKSGFVPRRWPGL